MRRRAPGGSPLPRSAATLLAVIALLPQPARAVEWEAATAEATSLLRRYIRIDTSNPPGDVTAAVAFLRRELASAGIRAETFQSAPGRVNVLARLGPGRGPAVVLLHHMDVVPAVAADWSVPPFSGELRDGLVWGRGALDDKGHGIAQLETVLLLARERAPLGRDVVFLATADEEVGGALGAEWMVEREWERIGAGVVINEGGFGLAGVLGASTPTFLVATAEKRLLWLRLVAHGQAGHGSQPHELNPNDILTRALGRIVARPAPYRMTPVVAEMLAALSGRAGFPASFGMRHAGNPLLFPFVRRRMAGDRAMRAILHDTVSITRLASGMKENVIPAAAEATLDCRLLPDTDPQAFIDRLRGTIDDPRVTIEILQQSDPGGRAAAAGRSYDAIVAGLETTSPGSTVAPLLTSGATDSRFFRRRGVAAYGMMPAVLRDDDLARVHGVDERISVENLRRATIATYEIVRRLAQ